MEKCFKCATCKNHGNRAMKNWCVSRVASYLLSFNKSTNLRRFDNASALRDALKPGDVLGGPVALQTPPRPGTSCKVCHPLVSRRWAVRWWWWECCNVQPLLFGRNSGPIWKTNILTAQRYLNVFWIWGSNTRYCSSSCFKRESSLYSNSCWCSHWRVEICGFFNKMGTYMVPNLNLLSIFIASSLD